MQGHDVSFKLDDDGTFMGALNGEYKGFFYIDSDELSEGQEFAQLDDELSCFMESGDSDKDEVDAISDKIAAFVHAQ